MNFHSSVAYILLQIQYVWRDTFIFISTVKNNCILFGAH